MLRLLNETAKASDFVVIKVDIDTPLIELSVVRGILENPGIASLVDVSRLSAWVAKSWAMSRSCAYDAPCWHAPMHIHRASWQCVGEERVLGCGIALLPFPHHCVSRLHVHTQS